MADENTLDTKGWKVGDDIDVHYPNLHVVGPITGFRLSGTLVYAEVKDRNGFTRHIPLAELKRSAA